MPTYAAPTRDINFLLNEWLDLQQYSDISGFEDVTPEFTETVVESMGRFAEEVTFPLNMSGDRQGCRWEDGEVTAPDGFKEAYRQFSEDGWFSLSSEPEYGGQGLPAVLGLAVTEMLISSNVSFSMFTGLNKGAMDILEQFGSTKQKELFLPRLNSGEWNATMDLTEGNAGTDLGLMRTRAEPQPDGSFHIYGSKIFISSGEHDLADNIIHMVLAKIPGGPSGSKGISLFIVPKYHINPDGSSGEKNAVFCDSIEEKLGLHGSATCAISYEAAVGQLVGKEHDGMRAMFAMMNTTRLFVGLQALALSEVAYQNAADYTRERLQGRVPGSANPSSKADKIIKHPDVRRMLMFCKSFTEGARALCYWTGVQLDVSKKHADAEVRKEAAELVALLTPVVKAYTTDVAEISTSNAMQCFGGHGYIVETGMEQYLRDVRIGRIFEGANGVQAMDLVGRKLLASGGSGLNILLDKINNFIQSHGTNEALVTFTGPLQKGLYNLEQASQWVFENAKERPENVGSVASHYLALLGIVSVSFMWSLIALKCVEEKSDKSFYQNKIKTGRFFLEQMIPDTFAHLARIEAGSESVMALDDEAF